MPREQNQHKQPIFSAVSSSARQLFTLLRCVGFSPKAQVQITKDGLRFSVAESRVMQGLIFLEKSLFTSYHYTPLLSSSTSGMEQDHSGDPDSEPSPEEDEDPSSSPSEDDPTFLISLPALLETLQIFSSTSDFNSSSTKTPFASSTTANNNPNSTSNPRHRSTTSAFAAPSLGLSSLCRLSYHTAGSPLLIVLEEGSVTTTCRLTTYTTNDTSLPPEIPLDVSALTMKIILRSAWLHDAIAELASTNPARLSLTCSPSAPYFSLSSSGPLGSATVEFSSKDPNLLETFSVRRRCTNRYSFALIKKTARAMGVASKVSVRGDEGGVLNLQFLVEVEVGRVAFVDFRFVAFLEGEDGEKGEDVEIGDGDEEDEGDGEAEL